MVGTWQEFSICVIVAVLVLKKHSALEFQVFLPVKWGDNTIKPLLTRMFKKWAFCDTGGPSTKITILLCFIYFYSSCNDLEDIRELQS